MTNSHIKNYLKQETESSCLTSNPVVENVLW